MSLPPQPRAAAERIRSLDGLRALAIGLVIFSHLAAMQGSPIPRTFLSRIDLGNLGVRVFFVISGLLITTLLVREREQTGTIGLRNFYLRRTLRIFPPYYVFLGVCLAASYVGWIVMSPGDYLHALLYVSNYRWLSAQSWLGYPLGHTWSLAIEEQFYLLWPAALVLLGARRGLWSAIGFVLLAPVLRLTAFHLPLWRAGVGHAFETTADAIATGCVLALAREWLWQQRLYRALIRSPFLLLAPVFLVVLDLTRDRPHVFLGFTITAMNVLIALLVDRCISSPESGLGRLLNATPLVYVGTMSYSLYLWQQLFLTGTPPAFTGRFPLNLLLVLACAWASFRLVEKPMNRLRARLDNRAPGSPTVSGAAPAHEKSRSEAGSPPTGQLGLSA
jgi:peptidoglycan/LPS O-acetylase OafA/YrhL